MSKVLYVHERYVDGTTLIFYSDMTYRSPEWDNEYHFAHWKLEEDCMWFRHKGEQYWHQCRREDSSHHIVIYEKLVCAVIEEALLT